MWLKVMFCNSISLGLIWNYDQSSAVLFSAVIVTGEDVDSAKVFKNESFRAFK